MRLFHSRRHGCSVRGRAFVGALVLTAAVLTAPSASAYSVLTHEGMVDAMWQPEIAPLLQQRFGPLTSKQLAEARAYAYGGSLIQDLGYYPFGSRLFTDLMHYVRAGDFVESLLAGATHVNEYAFALGALAHYNSDCAGHPLAVNRVVPMMYPKVRAKVGPDALYVDSPARHVMVEFAFDVLQVARGAYVAQAYHDRIGFEVAKPLLERSVRATYGLELGDVLPNVDLAIGTYRRAVGTTIPELTRIAWRDKRDDIEKATPGVTAEKFVFVLSPADYDRQFGKNYRKPSLFSRILAFALKILPKIGPLRPLAFEPLTPEADALLAESVAASRVRYRATLRSLRSGPLRLPNTDFDTGRPPVRGVNRLADETYADLLHRLAGHEFAGVPPELCRELNAFFAHALPTNASLSRSRARRIERDLRAMNSEALTRSASAGRRHAGSP